MENHSIISLLHFATILFAFLFPTAFLAGAVNGPVTPEQSLQYLKTEPGLRVELVVAEPMVVDPVALAWDERGRMFVVENRGYPTGPGQGRPPAGQVVLLEDSDSDGKFDKRTVYADGMTFPNGIMPWDGGVYVTCAPYLYYFKDTDGDGRADTKKIVFKGFQDLSTTQLRVSHPTLNLDNWVYLTSGLTAARVTSPAYTNRLPVLLNRVDGRFRPGADEIEETAGTAQFGQTFDAFGRRFICSNRNHIQQVVLQTRYTKRNPNFSLSEVVEDIPEHGAACRVYPLSANITTAAWHTGYFTSACGLLIYLGTALPAAYRGNSFVCEPAGNLVHRDVLVDEGGVTFVARRSSATNEFLASPDDWFRPVNLATGPDGAMYICDMYRKTIEHPDYLPEATRKVTDFESGKDKGRIYRITSDQTSRTAKKRTKFDLGKATTKELVAELDNADVWWRMTGQRLLLERQDKSGISQLASLAEKGRQPETRVHALRVLEGLGALSIDSIARALADPSPGVREQGIQLAEPRAAGSAVLSSRLQKLADDSDARVRFQCALSLGALTNESAIAVLVRITTNGSTDKWLRSAALTAITGREEQFLRALLPFVRGLNSDALPLLMGDLGRMLGLSCPPENLVSVLGELVGSGHGSDLAWQMAAVGGLGEGLRARGRAAMGISLPQLAGQTAASIRQAFEKLLLRSASLAVNPEASVNSRLAAIRLLSHSEDEDTRRTLENLMDPQQPSEIQSAAIRAVSQLSDPEAGAVLVKRERWNGYTPAVRDVVLAALMTSTNLLQALFDAIEAGDVPAWTVNADRRTALMKHKDGAIRTRAKSLFADLTPGDRMKTYEEFKSVLTLKADSKNGQNVFQKNCVTCHVVAGEGKLVGPDLTGIRNQPAEVLLLHVIVPEYEIMPTYTSYTVETKDGQAYSGLLATEAPGHITLRMAQAIEQQIPRSDILSMTTSRLSLMPQELEKAMTRQELADLIAFLKGE